MTSLLKKGSGLYPVVPCAAPRDLSGPSGGSDGKQSASRAGNPGLIPGSGDPLEKETATHSSILAWRNPWAEEPGGLQSVG